MKLNELDEYLFKYTESEKSHKNDSKKTLSKRYRNIPKITFQNRELYLFSFKTLFEDRLVCVNKESRFTFIPEHIHTVIEFLYVYSGKCTQIIDGREIILNTGDICMLDSNVPHSIGYLNEEDIVITIEIQKEYLINGFLQRLGDNGIINNFLINAMSSDTSHNQYLLFQKKDDNSIHTIIQNILCEYYEPSFCTQQVIDAYMVLLFCEILRKFKDQQVAKDKIGNNRIISILDYMEKNYLDATLESTAYHFGFHPNYLSKYIKKSVGKSFKELIIIQRLSHACFYLTNTELPIYEIAAKVGYDNLGFFYKKFESTYNITPQLYRETKTQKISN